MILIDIDRLKQEVNGLELVTDKLNKRLELIERAIGEIRPGIAAWVLSDNDKSVSYGYCKINDSWHLAVKVDERIIDILHSARYHRYMCFKMRQKIVDALVEVAKSTANRWEKAIDGSEDIRWPDEEERIP